MTPGGLHNILSFQFDVICRHLVARLVILYGIHGYDFLSFSAHLPWPHFSFFASGHLDASLLPASGFFEAFPAAIMLFGERELIYQVLCYAIGGFIIALELIS